MIVRDLTEAMQHVRLMQQPTDATDGLVNVADSHVCGAKWGVNWHAHKTRSK